VIPHLKLVPLTFGAVLHESNLVQADVYFPTTATLSIVTHTADGRSTAVATVGNDGLAGIALFMAGDRSPNETIVQGAGYAYRMRSSVAKSESARGGALQHFAMRYAQALMTEMAQTAACNRLHTTEQQLCRWLLLSTYHSACSTIVVTQRLIANALGTRREAIAEAAAKLRAAKLISCGRGYVSILDRERLQTHGCDCYTSAKREVDRLLPYRVPVNKMVSDIALADVTRTRRTAILPHHGQTA
jgi:CRP-like cAMP-binding protein